MGKPKFELSFRVDSLPVAQPRPRIVQPHRHARAMAVSAPKSHPVYAFRQAVTLAAQQAYDGDPMHMPLFLKIDFFFPRPSNKRWKKQAMPREWKTTRPDLDNLIKGVKDALSGVLWTDDSQVVDLRVGKFIVAGMWLEGVYQQEPVGCEIVVREAGYCH